jgi:hypothetical protein
MKLFRLYQIAERHNTYEYNAVGRSVFGRAKLITPNTGMLDSTGKRPLTRHDVDVLKSMEKHRLDDYTDENGTHYSICR